MRSKRGFSLIELMVVVSIIGVLASLASMSWNKMSCRAAETEAKSVLGSLAAVQEKAFAEGGAYIDSLGPCSPYNGDCANPELTIGTFGKPRFVYSVTVVGATYTATASGYRGQVLGTIIAMDEKRAFTVKSVCP